VLAIAGSVGFPIAGQRQAGAHHADHHQRMLIALNLFRSVLLRPTERATLVSPPSRTGAIDGQTDPAAIIKGFVALGATDEGEQGLPGGTGIEPLGEITQRIVTEWSGDGECSSRRGTRQRLDRMKTGFPEDLSDQQGPEQSRCRNLGLPPTISRVLKIVSKSQTPHRKIPHATRRWTTHFFFFCCFSCFRARTKSFALAARTSRTAS
jgi:hypothetical protein